MIADAVFRSLALFYIVWCVSWFSIFYVVREVIDGFVSMSEMVDPGMRKFLLVVAAVYINRKSGSVAALAWTIFSFDYVGDLIGATALFDSIDRTILRLVFVAYGVVKTVQLIQQPAPPAGHNANANVGVLNTKSKDILSDATGLDVNSEIFDVSHNDVPAITHPPPLRMPGMPAPPPPVAPPAPSSGQCRAGATPQGVSWTARCSIVASANRPVMICDQCSVQSLRLFALFARHL